MQNYKPLKMIIVGAGAAGYVAAAVIRRKLPHIDVTIIHDPKTPHIGVGETLAWNASFFMREYLGLSDKQWMKDSESVYKFGIKLVGWNGEGDDDILYSLYWWNPHINIFDKSIHSAYEIGTNGDKHFGYVSAWEMWLNLYKKGLRTANDRYGDLSEIFWYTQYNTVPWNESGQPAISKNNITYNINSDYFRHTVHKLVGEPNGVKIIPIPVKEVKMDGEKIKSLILGDESEHTADLYVDCTGFGRLLAKKIPSFVWEDCDEYFNNASLVGRAYEPDNEYPTSTFTDFYSMKYGWAFSVPFGPRSGNGYQFNRNIYSNEDAICEEFEQRFPNKKNVITKKLTWDPGFYNKIFSENCILLGISHGFGDVFDSNNFSSNLTFIMRLVNYLQQDTAGEFGWKDDYNNAVNSIVESIKFRIQTCFHTSPRNDTVYWQTMKEARDKLNTEKRFTDSIYKIAGRQQENNIFFAQGQHANHILHYGLDFEPTAKKFTDKQEQLALNFFKYFNEKNRISAMHGTPLQTFNNRFYR